MDIKDIVFEQVIKNLKENNFKISKIPNEDYKLEIDLKEVKMIGGIVENIDNDSVMFAFTISAEVVSINKERSNKAILARGVGNSTTASLAVTFPKKKVIGPVGIVLQSTLTTITIDKCNIADVVKESVGTFKNAVEYFCSELQINWADKDVDFYDIALKTYVDNKSLIKEIIIKDDENSMETALHNMFGLAIDFGPVDDIDDLEEQLKQSEEDFETLAELWEENSTEGQAKYSTSEKKSKHRKKADIKGLSLD